MALTIPAAPTIPALKLVAALDSEALAEEAVPDVVPLPEVVVPLPAVPEVTAEGAAAV